MVQPGPSLPVTLVDSSGNLIQSTNPLYITAATAAFAQGASYVIQQIGANIYAVPAPGSGLTAYSGTVFSTVANNALAGLSAGRTYKQKILVIGNFTITATLTPVSYTILEIQGALTVSGDIKGIYATGSQIEIVNGEVNGNNQAATQGNHIIHMYQVTDGLVQNCYVHAVGMNNSLSSTYGVAIENCTRTYARQCRTDSCYHACGEIFNASTDCDIDHCSAYLGGTGAAHFVIIGGAGTHCTRCNIIDCKSVSPGLYGAEIYQYCDDCWVRGGNYYDNQTGVVVDINGTCTGCGAIGFTVRQPDRTAGGRFGVVTYSNNAILSDFIAVDCNLGIGIEGSASGCRVSGTVQNSGSHCLVVHGANCDFNASWWNVYNNGDDATVFYAGASNNTVRGAFIGGYTSFIFNAAANNNLVQGVTFNHSTPVTDNGSGNQILNCAGYNPQGFAISSPNVPASGANATNTFNFPIIINITGIGNVSTWSLTDPSSNVQNFTGALTVGQQIRLDPLEKIKFGYSSAPSWKWYGT